MNPNSEIWGSPETWDYSPHTTLGLTSQLAQTLNADRPKVAHFGGTTAEYTGSLLQAINVAQKMELNEFIDNSICPCGQDPAVSPFAKVAIFNENDDLSTTPRVVTITDNINWFFADKAVTVPYSNGFEYFKQYTRQNVANEGLKYQQFAPKANDPANHYNIDMQMCPYTYYGLRSLFLSIEVHCMPKNASNPIINTNWRTLRAWQTQYSTTEDIIGLRLYVRTCQSINEGTHELTYSTDKAISGGQQSFVCVTNPITINNDGTDTPTQMLSIYNKGSRCAYIFDITDQISAWFSGSDSRTNRAVLPCWEYFNGQTINFYKPTSSDPLGYYYYKIPYSEETYNKIMSIAALFGCFFTDRNVNVFPYDMLTEYAYLPIIDENGIAHGEYTNGAANATNSLYSKSSIRDVDYDPTKPPSPIPSGDPMLPEGLYFTMANRGTGIWALTPTEVDQVWNDIFGKNIDVKMFGNQPMNAILSLKWTPFNWDIGSLHNQPVVLGDTVVNRLHKYPMIETVIDAEIHGYGTMKFNYDKNFYNARFMQARLFLPFYGYYELPAAQLLSSKLRVDFYYNVPDELGVYIISYDDVIYDYCECSVDIDVPLTGSNAAAIAASKRSEALTIATQIAAMTTAAVVGWSGISAVGAGIKTIAEAGAESAWAFGGSKLLGGLANIGPLASENLLPGVGKGLVGIGAGGGVGGIGIANTIQNAKIDRAALRTNLPYHGSALQTTFLHMSMKPYVQIFKNAIMEGLEKSNNEVDQTLGGETERQYKLKVGHACDVWKTISEMPENSLLQATGIADSSVVNMELAEVQELNSILQSGFFK